MHEATSAPRILVVSHSADLAGAERSLLETLDALTPEYEVRVTVPREGPLCTYIRLRGLEYRVVPIGPAYRPREARLVRRLKWAALFLLRLPAFVRVVSEWRPHVVMTNTVVAWYGPIAALLMRVPHVWHLRELTDPDWLGAPILGGLLERWMLRQRDATFLANSRFTRDHYRARFGIDAVVVNQAVRIEPSALQLRAARVMSLDAPMRIGVFGRVSRVKGQSDVVEALAALPGRYRGAWHLSLFGSSEPARYVDHLMSSVIAYGLQEYVTVEGFTAAPNARMADLDLVIVASHDEPFGRVAVEAMKLGVPVIGARSGGTSELLQDGRYGLTYASGDSQGLAAVLEDVFGGRYDLQSRVEEAQAWANARFNDDAYRSAVLRALSVVL